MDKYLDKVVGEVAVTDGVARWTTNGRCLFADDAAYYATEHGLPVDVDKQKAAKAAEDREFLAAYAAAQPAEPTAEERFEALAAFGPGAEVVDVFTGRRFTT